MKLVNLTPHKINIYGEDKKLILSVGPENVSAQCSQKKEICGYVGEIPVYRMSFGPVFDIPVPKKDTVYIVSSSVAAAAVERVDVYCPGSAVRDEKGRVIGCIGLSRAPHD